MLSEVNTSHLICYHWLVCHMHFWGLGGIQRAKIRFKCRMFDSLNFWYWSTNILSYIINVKNVADLMLVNETVSPRNANRERITSKTLSRLVLGSSWRSSVSSTLAVLCDRGHRVTAPGCHSALALHTVCSAWPVELEGRVWVWGWAVEWLWEGGKSHWKQDPVKSWCWGLCPSPYCRWILVTWSERVEFGL